MAHITFYVSRELGDGLNNNNQTTKTKQTKNNLAAGDAHTAIFCRTPCRKKEAFDSFAFVKGGEGEEKGQYLCPLQNAPVPERCSLAWLDGWYLHRQVLQINSLPVLSASERSRVIYIRATQGYRCTVSEGLALKTQ